MANRPRLLTGFGTWSDQRAERTLGALACTVLVLILAMVVFVLQKAWPSFSHNGLAWFGPGGNVDDQLGHIFRAPANPKDWAYTLHAWPLIYGTALVTLGAVLIGVVVATLSAAFIVEFAPPFVRRILEPVVRLLAAVPSVIYGLIGILVLVPFINKLISQSDKHSVEYVVQLDGSSLLVAVIILTVMITPIMIAIITDALLAVPTGWTQGALALGVNRWRVMRTITLRAARPAIIAAVVLATARALGEAIMLAMVSGSVAWSPNPLDGILFFLEPVRPLASTIVTHSEGLSVPPFAQTIYAFAAVLLVSNLALSLGGWAAKRPLRKFGVAGGDDGGPRTPGWLRALLPVGRRP
jgi:phosphate ABC transporter permease protein PstC